VKIKGKRKLFQTVRKDTRKTAAIPDFESGYTIHLINCQRLQPSIVAASSISGLISLTKVDISHIPRGSRKTINSIIMPESVSIKPALLIMKNKAIMETQSGKGIISMRKKKKNPFPLNFILANT
jgi:hypothetical protein